MHSLALHVQLFWPALCHRSSAEVPPGTLQEETVDERPVCWRPRGNVLAKKFKIERECVNRQLVLARVVLQRARHERLREEEPRDPEGYHGEAGNRWAFCRATLH